MCVHTSVSNYVCVVSVYEVICPFGVLKSLLIIILLVHEQSTHITSDINYCYTIFGQVSPTLHGASIINRLCIQAHYLSHL